jgi:hypothetical protein
MNGRLAVRTKAILGLAGLLFEVSERRRYRSPWPDDLKLRRRSFERDS